MLSPAQKKTKGCCFFLHLVVIGVLFVIAVGPVRGTFLLCKRNWSARCSVSTVRGRRCPQAEARSVSRSLRALRGAGRLCEEGEAQPSACASGRRAEALR